MDFISAEPVEFSRQGLHSVNLKLIMRVSCIYTVLSFLAVGVFATHPTFSQTPGNRITKIGLENETLAAVFAKIKEQTGLAIYYPGRVDEYKNISLTMAKRTVKEVLDLVLEETDLSYRFGDNMVMLYVIGKENEEGGYPVEASSGTSVIFTVSGKVMDAITQQTLPGASIVVKGTTRGTTTDGEGRFVIDVNENEVIVFSFIGYKRQEITIIGQTTFNVSLEADVNKLETVTINAGYYTTTERTRTGNITKITSKEIENQPVTSPLMALQGRVPGLDITPTSGIPGSAINVVLRGRNSLRSSTLDQASNSPLFIIDGVPVDATPLVSGSLSVMQLGSDPLSALNPNNIEKIEVLKDADATAVYGSRGANGVILITTKQGKSRKTGFDINVGTGAGKLSNRMDLLNTEQYLTMRREAFKNDGTTPQLQDYDVNGRWDTTRYTDWQDVLLGGTATINTVQAGVSGGTGNTSFTLDGGYHKETVIYPGSFGFHRVTGHLNVNHLSADQKFSVNSSVTYGRTLNKVFESSAFASKALELPPNAPALRKENGELNWEVVDGFGYSFNNPLAELKKTNEANQGNFLTNLALSYEIFPGVNVKANAGFTEVNEKGIIKYPLAARPPVFGTDVGTGQSSFGRNYRRSWIGEPQLSYYGNFDNHNLNITAGATWQESTSEGQVLIARGYTSDVLLNSLQGATQTVISVDFNNQYKYTALFGRIGYDFRGKYFINLTGRRDGSSRFGPGKRFGNFGAIGAAWIFSKEDFISSNIRFLSFAKLRGSYGITGSDQVGDYNFYSTYRISDNPYQGGTSLSPTALSNPDFSWEATTKIEAALELGLLEDKISMEISWYRNRSSNQLVNYQLPATAGFESVLSNFDATVENSGWEGVLNFSIINRPDFRWQTSLNISANRNKLVAFPGIENSPYATLFKVGEPLSVLQVYNYKGVNPDTGEYEIEDVNDDGFIDNNDTQLMDPSDKKYYGGINNTLSYKSIELSFLFQFSKQEKPGYRHQLPGLRIHNQPVYVLDRWQTEGDITNVPKFSQNSFNRYGNQVNQSNYSITDASFIRLKTLSLSYKLPTDKIGLQLARIYIQGQNLFTITHYPGYDPETGTTLPPLRMIIGGIQLKI